MQKHIYIDLRLRHSSVEIYQPDNSRIRIRIRIRICMILRNNTHFNFVLDRLCLKFVYGIEVAKLFHFKREQLKQSQEKFIMLDGSIDRNQSEKLADSFQENASHCYIEVLAECDSRLHNFSIEKELNGIKPDIHNKHLLEKSKVD